MIRPGHEQIRCVVADPPWPCALDEASAELFEVEPSSESSALPAIVAISLAEIHALAPVTAPLAHLWLWAPPQHIDWAHDTARAWGFAPVHLLTWAQPGLVSGDYRPNTQYLLLARKGGPRKNAFGRMSGTHFRWPVPPGGAAGRLP